MEEAFKQRLGTKSLSAFLGRRSRTARSSIKVTVKRPEELFHELDPSPLIGRDLDEQFERYIVDTARELPSNSSLALSVDVPCDKMPPNIDADDLADAIRAYFAYRRDQEWVKLRRIIREGRGALVVGMAFLFVCGAAGVLSARAWSEPFGSFLKEGFLIIGWVALWRPVEMLLYDWRPIRKEYRLLERLARMPVRFTTLQTSA